VAEWLTVRETAERLGVGPERVRQLCRWGYLPSAVKRGQDWFVPVAELERYLELEPGVKGRPRRLE
jgi:excisionase family DNA binding protein